MSYIFKPGPELAWLVIVTISTVLSQAVLTQGMLPPTDWKAWAIALIAGVIRAILGAVLDMTRAGGDRE